MDSDPDIEFVDKDSGMSSLGGSKDETPERRPTDPEPERAEAGAVPISTIQSENETRVERIERVERVDKEENYDDEPDETIAERLWGLSEMFPEPVRNFCGTVTDFSISTVKNVFQFSCNASWIFFTSSMILFAPVIFETERAQMEEMQKTQQKQVLLGPGSAIASGGGGLPALPPMTR